MKDIKKTAGEEYLNVIKKDFAKYKSLGDKTFEKLEDADFHYKISEEENSIAILIQHLCGNMFSRFTDFLTTDGEKPNRNRDTEFEERQLTREQLIKSWEDGWKVLNKAINSLSADDLICQVLIRNEPHSVIEALNRQATHYSYHIGQIILIAKQIKKENWKTLSVAKGKTKEFNRKMFAKKY